MFFLWRFTYCLFLQASWRSTNCLTTTWCPQTRPMRTWERLSVLRNKDRPLQIAGAVTRYPFWFFLTLFFSNSASSLMSKSLRNQLITTAQLYKKNPPSFVSSVSTTDGKIDVGVLGSQPGLSPHSPEGEEDPGQDVRVPRHQTVTGSWDRRCHQPRLVTATGTAPLTPANRRKGKKRDCEWWDKGNWQGGWAMEIMVGGEPEKWEAGRFITPEGGGGGGGGTRSALPEVWGSYRALRLCFLWKLNARRVQSVTAEERTRIPLIGCEQRKVPARPTAEFCVQTFVLPKLLLKRSTPRRRHPSKEMCNASSVTSLSMTYNYCDYFIIMGIERRRVN